MKDEVYWYTQQQHEVISLASDLSTEVLVIGGGMTGLMAADAFCRRGKEVVLIEKDFCGAGASGKTSGFITPDSELELGDLISRYGVEKARHLWKFALEGVEGIRATIKENSINCDYQAQNSCYVANTARGMHDVMREHQSRIRLEFESRLYEQHEMPTVIGSSTYFGGVRYPDTFGINSYLYCQSLKNALVTRGVKIFEGTSVNSIVSDGATTDRYRIRARWIIVATDRFLPMLRLVRDQIYHVQTYLGISKPLTNQEVKTIFPDQRMMVWDTDVIYHYYRITGDNRLLLGGSDLLFTYLPWEIHAVGRAHRRHTRFFQKKFPAVPVELEYVWPGLLGISKDFLPIAGIASAFPNVYIIGGAAGLPWAARLGRYAAEKFLDDRDDYDQDFTPHRTFPINPPLQWLLSKPLTFAIAHGISKYLKK